MDDAGMNSLVFAVAAALWLVVCMLSVHATPKVIVSRRLSPVARNATLAGMLGTIALGGGLLIWLFPTTYRPARSCFTSPAFAVVATLWLVMCMLIGRTQAKIVLSPQFSPRAKEAMNVGLAATIALSLALIMWLFGSTGFPRLAGVG